VFSVFALSEPVNISRPECCTNEAVIEQTSSPETLVPPVIPLNPEAAKEASPAKAPKPIRAVLLYLVILLLGAAIAAPRFHASASFLAENNPAWRGIANEPFYRFVLRSLLLFAFVGLPIFLKALQIHSARSLGFRFSTRNWAEGLQGLAWGFALLAIAVALSLAFEARAWRFDHTPAEWVRHWRNTALAAIAVALIEEALFRGALFSSLRQLYRFWPAALVSSAVYALVHFFKHPDNPDSIEWYSGLVMLGRMLHGFIEWNALVPGFINLALIGLILALAVERTGSLLFSIGLHASLVFWVKTSGFMTKQLDVGNPAIWGTTKLVDGWASGFLLLAVFLVLRKILPHPEKKDA